MTDCRTWTNIINEPGTWAYSSYGWTWPYCIGDPSRARTAEVQTCLKKGTFSWFGGNPRLAKDFENLADTLPTFVTTLASIQLALRRLART